MTTQRVSTNRIANGSVTLAKTASGSIAPYAFANAAYNHANAAYATANIGQVNIDFGSNAVYQLISYVNDSRATLNSKIIVLSSAYTANSEYGSEQLGGDELILDNFLVSANVISAGNMAFYITASPGPVKGQRNFNYIITG